MLFRSQCAVCLAALDGFDEVLRARRSRAAWLRHALEPLGCTFQRNAELGTWQSVPVLVRDAATRERIRRRAEAADVELRAYFETPLHAHPPFTADPRADALCVTDDLASRCLSLPMANDLRDDEMARIVAVLDEEA